MKPELFDYVDKKIKEVVRSHGSHLRRSVYDIMVHNYSLEKVGAYSEYRVKPNGYWTLETCKEDALKYKTRSEWQKSKGDAYLKAHKQNWLEECCGHMKSKKKPHRYWTLDKCKASALKYKTRSEWREGEAGAYNASFKNNWLEECCGHMVSTNKPMGFWTLDNCKASALKYKTRTQWQKSEGGAYNTALKENFVDECCQHMSVLSKPSDYWTLDKCKESALKYKTRSKWQKGENGAYGRAFKNNWLKECCGHMGNMRKPRTYWTLETCKTSAINYKTRGEWSKGESSAYNAALKNNWLDECCQHMEGRS